MVDDIIKEEDINKKQSLDLLKDAAKEQKIESMKKGEINWIDDDYWGEWKKIKGHCKNLLGSGEEYTREDVDWFFMCHSKDEIKGKAQLIETVQKRIPLIRRATKKVKLKKSDPRFDKSDEDGKLEIQRMYFFDEHFDKRHDGFQVDAFAMDFKMYKVISDDNKEYYVLSKEDIPNEVCVFKGMSVELDDVAEVSRSMKIKSLSRIFFLHSFEPEVKALHPTEIIKYTKARGITEEKWFDFLDYNEIGTYNRFPEECNYLRSAHILSSKVDGWPLHLAVMGPAGTRKSMGYIETIAYKFSEQPAIIEGGNSRIKGLSPSFKEKPANLGYLALCQRMGWIDEIGKMVEFEINKHQSGVTNVLGELNFLLEHKIREVSSGNDNSCIVQANSKFTFVTNPVRGKKDIYRHVGLIDPTTMSRMLWWVQDEAEQEFVTGENGVERLPPTPTQAQDIGNFTCIDTKNTKNTMGLKMCWGELDNREEFLTLFDTCNSFICSIDEDRVNTLSNTITQLAREPMKGVWKPRGPHHVKLIVDGLIKHRCMFKDYDETFKAKDEDYDMAEKILLRMVKAWDTDLSPKDQFSQ